MAAKQSRFEEVLPVAHTFTDTPPESGPPADPPMPVPEDGAEQSAEPPSPAPEPPRTPPLSPSQQAAGFFLSCLTSEEQQLFQDYCAMRGLAPEAGMLAFMKEKIQRSEMQAGNNSAFLEEAQQVVDEIQAQTPAAPLPPGTALTAYQVGRKPTKPCAVCGTPFTVDFRGRMLCQNPACWHEYAGLTSQRPSGGAALVEAETSRRLGRLESMMERMAAGLDKLVGA